MISQEMSSKEYEGFEGSGDWLDEVDLKSKYAEKPEQVAAIMQNANTMVHPTRRVTLYEDIDYKSKRGIASSYTTTTKRSACQEDVRKAEKTKAEPKPKCEAKPLDEAGREKLTKSLASVDKFLDQMTKSRCDADEDNVKEYIPAKIREVHDTAGLTLGEAKATINMALSEHWEGDLNATLREVNAAKKEATDKDSKLKNYVKQAKS